MRKRTEGGCPTAARDYCSLFGSPRPRDDLRAIENKSNTKHFSSHVRDADDGVAAVIC